jgi:predicted oxidoreductase
MSTRREFLTQTATASLVATASSALTRGATLQDPPSSGSASADGKNASSGSKGRMKTYKIPRTDLVVSRIAYGCAMLGLDWNSPDFVAKTVPNIKTAYEQGISFFDTADVYGYGKAELALGEVLKRSPELRSKIVIQSKCGATEGVSVDNSREHILTSVDGSLKRLDTEHLDILLLHWPDSLVQPEEVAKAFDDLHRSGKVRYFGISNHSSYQIDLLQRYVRQPLVINQVQLGLAHWYTKAGPSKGSLTHGAEGVVILDYCRAHDIQIQAYSPLRAGNIKRPPNLLNLSPDAAPEVQKAAQALADVAANHATSPSAVMLAWLLHHPAHIVPIIGTTKPEHVIDNCAADRVELTRVEWYTLLEAAAQIESEKPV